MKKITLATLSALALSGALPSTLLPSLSPALAQSASTIVTPNRYGLPDFGDLVESVGPAVVNISVVRRYQNNPHNFGGISPDDPFYDLLRRFGIPAPGIPGPQRGPSISQGIGSGFIISKDGYVLTNAHVVGEGDSEVTVRLIDKREFPAKVIGIDSRTDVAVLKIEADNLPTVKMGDTEKVRVGEWVVAMGSPFGFDNTVTAGIVSAKARRLQSENYVPFIQTDVAINPGNSGGPLFNLAGEVIGINSQIYSRSGGFMGISFAIPIDVALNVKEQLIEHGRVQRGKLGVMIQSVDKELAQTFGLDIPKGALISSIEPESAAERAGLQPGDVVLSVDGVKIDDSADLPRVIGEKRPGSKITLEIWRDRKSQKVSVTLDEMQSQLVAGKNQITNDALGLSARALSAEEARQIGVRGGLFVESVNGVAAEAGIRHGDIILALNNQPVTNLADFRKILDRAGKQFALLVQRGESRIFLPIRLK